MTSAPFTLMSHGRALGRTGVELPPPAPGTRSWQFIPGPAFEDARTVFAELPAAIEDSQEAIPTQGELAEYPEAERAERMREIMLADPRMARFIALSQQLDALALTLVDAEGAPVEAATIGVTTLDIGADEFREALTSIDPRADVSTIQAPPFHLLVISCR